MSKNKKGEETFRFYLMLLKWLVISLCIEAVFLVIFTLIGYILFKVSILIIIMVASLVMIVSVIIALVGIKRVKIDMAKDDDVATMDETEGQELVLVYFYFSFALTIFFAIIGIGSLFLQD